ncbi:MAG: helicase SNF2 [Lysobacter sp.]|nr:MAG: helicase SNF2 [Lysobacter sp.]
MPITLKAFQEQTCAAIVARFGNVRDLYRSLANAAPERLDEARRNDAVLVLQAPTGSGKTLLAVEAMRRVSAAEPVLWFWFAPFTGLVDQSRRVVAQQAPELPLLDLGVDRQLDAVRAGGVFVSTWAALAARNAESRRARTTGDAGLAIDAVIAQARSEGIRIGCVIDEAHHTAMSGTQARIFFTDVLKPDYALFMTATPNDADIAAFGRATRYTMGEPADWASVSRFDAVEAGLLKPGVRMVRFIARDGDTAQLVDFEHLALRECADLHARIRRELSANGVPLTPLMLVQVPNGGEALRQAQRYLVEQLPEELRFPASAVRVHTADEPDPDLLALAQDPTVEVLVFKMAVALGFDAPRAFTLAALRGTRDVDFGVQVIGRIVRRHALLQSRPGLPELLNHGYVFLANSESQEGLLQAGAQINRMVTQSPELGTQTVLTVVGDRAEVQIARSGEPLSLLVSRDGVTQAAATDAGLVDVDNTALFAVASPLVELANALQASLALPGGPDESVRGARVATAFALAPQAQYRYPRRADAPDRLRGERLPSAPVDFEAGLAAHVDFSPEVLADRFRSRVQVQRHESNLFDGHEVRDDGAPDLWATLAPEAVAERAEQIRLRLRDANDRELFERLLARFVAAIEASGAEVPREEEERMQQLDLVLVRRPHLLREAYARMRQGHVVDVDISLPSELTSDQRLAPAARGLYGVYPPGMNTDEQAVAALLDASPHVAWWHRNPAMTGVGLYRWDEGDGFYPDFVVGLRERPGSGIALLEVKGEHLWGKESEVEKSQAAHPEYGAMFMVGRRRGDRDYVFLRALQGKLQSDGAFAIDRMRFS